MKRKNIVKGILLHICTICSIACLIMKVLDWYNPYMDFIGHASFVEYALYFSVIVLNILEWTFGSRNRNSI